MGSSCGRYKESRRRWITVCWAKEGRCIHTSTCASIEKLEESNFCQMFATSSTWMLHLGQIQEMAFGKYGKYDSCIQLKTISSGTDLPVMISQMTRCVTIFTAGRIIGIWIWQKLSWFCGRITTAQKYLRIQIHEYDISSLRRRTTAQCVVA